MRIGRLRVSVAVVVWLLVVKAQQPEGPRANLDTHSTLQRLIQILQYCGMEESRAMKRVYLSTPNVTCNDGSPAGFYLRRSHGSQRWIVFLEGGWYCYDHQSCLTRWQRLRHLMTSHHWPETRSVMLRGWLPCHCDLNIRCPPSSDVKRLAALSL